MILQSCKDIQQNGGNFKIRNGYLLLVSWRCDVFLPVRKGDVEDEVVENAMNGMQESTAI